MDFSKKRKIDENGTAFTGGDTSPPLNLTTDDARKIIETFTKEQLQDILQKAVVRYPDVLDAVRSIADADTTQRKLFIRNLGFDTTTARLHSVFSAYGDIEDAVVVVDKTTGKSKGYGFVTFKHIDGAILSLKEPSKKIDGQIAVAQLAIANNTTTDNSNRKIYVGSVPAEMTSERLLGHFLAYGEIEEGPLGFDKQTGKSKGFAFFIYKTEEGAKTSLVDPIKSIDGHQLVCKMAVDNKKGGDKVSMPQQSSMPASQFNTPPYGGFTGGAPPLGHHQNNANSQMQSSIGSGYGGAYGGSSFVQTEYGGLNNAGSSMYRLPPSSVALPSGVFSESGHMAQHHGPPPVPRFPPGGMYQGMPPYY